MALLFVVSTLVLPWVVVNVLWLTQKALTLIAEVSGKVIIHSCPRAMTSHVEWALSRHLENFKTPTWNRQPAETGCVRTDFDWVGEYISASQIASSLLQIGKIRAEISTHPHDDSLGERFLLTPSLGIHRSVIDATGDCVIAEQRVRQLIFDCASELRAQGQPRAQKLPDWESRLQERLDDICGLSWDIELNVFRSAAYGADVRWLSSTA